MFKRLAAAAILAALLSSAPRAQEAIRYDDLAMHEIEYGGARRSAGLYVPSTYRPGQPAPLIMALHGRFSSAKAFHALSRLARVAEARGAILVYPETLGAYWSDGGHAALARRETPADDAGFLAAVLNAVAADYAVDPERVFLVGYDAGGNMAYSLACQRTPQFAAVAVVSALMWDYAVEACGPHIPPTPMLIVHGRRDDAYPVNGGSPPGARIEARRLGADDTVAFWRRVNACPERAASTGEGDSALFVNCASGASLAYVGVAGGAHDWFHTGPGYQLNRQGVDASALVDGFFFDRNAFALPRARASGARARSYIVYAPPSYEPSRPTPAVIMLHGRPGTAAGMATITQMNEVATRRGFIVVYPDGVGNQWNVQFDLVGQREVLPQDDVGFLEKLMQDLRVDLNIDPRRMYVAGFSNGGFMTMRMSCSSDGFAAFAEVGAALYVEMLDECRRSRPSPILLMHGTGDPSIPYDGVVLPNPQGGEPRRITLGVRETVAFFIRRNNCSYSGASTTFAESGRSPGTHVVRFAPGDCDADVVFYLINGGGHTWPGVPGVLDEDTFGALNMDMNAGEVIWEFFAAHSLPDAATR